MIIVEGPDNSGKSTLVRNLSEQLGLKVLKPNKKGPPKNQEDIYNNTKHIIAGALSHVNNRTIVDRFSLIGESIYGPICRGQDLWVSCFDKKMKMYSILRTIDPFFIYCRPPNSVVLDMKSHELKSSDTPEHIQRVEKNKALILTKI